MVGSIWLIVVLVFRILVFVAAVQQVWSDEHLEFICDTTHIGCTKVCYDQFFPISHSLWAIQIIFVTCPSLVVVALTKYRETKDRNLSTLPKRVHTCMPTQERSVEPSYNFDIPRVVKCTEEPCPNTVNCYNSRSKKILIFTLFMVISSAVCIFLCICEIFYLIVRAQTA